MSGGSTTTIQAAQPPSSAEAVNAWVSSLPQVYQTQMQYAPLEAAQQVALAQQYAGQLGQAYKTAQEAMYPEETAFTKNLLATAQTNANATELPASMASAYRDELRANIGTNIGSGIGADYTSRNMLNALENYRQYYQNLGLSIAGKQPVFGAQTPQTTNYMSNFTPSSILGYTSNNYATQVGGTQSMYQPSPYGQIFGGLMQGIGTGLGTAWGTSSKRFKKNIKTWA